ncbi:MAG: DUF4129 domain-containing protein [Chloroflexi bacterium]|nr:DUF4129 domain-containing protein [Chloroflexota bacterium]
MRLKSYNWLKAVLLPCALAAMEALWVYPWLVWIAVWALPELGRPAMNFLSALGLVLLSTLGVRYLLRQKWDLGWVQAVVVAGGILAILGVAEGEYLGRSAPLGGYSLSSPKMVVLAVGAYLWWRGINFGRSRPAFEDVNNAFLLGVAGLLGLLLVSIVTQTLPGYGGFQSVVALYVAGFFLVGLLALSLARLEMIREESLQAGAGLSFNRHWLAMLVGVISFILLTTFLVAVFFSLDLAQRLMAPLALAADGLYYLFYIVLLPISYLVAILIYLLRYLIALLRIGANTEQQTRPDYSEIERLRERAMNTGFPPEVIAVMKWLLLGLVAAAVVYFFVRAVLRYRQAQEDDVEEIHESLGSWQELKLGLLLLLRRMLYWLFPWRRPQASIAKAPVTRGPAFETSLAIREVYRQLLARAEALGAPRRPHQTPYEYLPALRGVVAEGAPEAATITEVYVRARYSPVPAAAGEVEEVNRTWEKLRGLLTPEKRIG